MRLPPRLFLLLLLLPILPVGGCLSALAQDPPAKRQFLLSATPPAKADGQGSVATEATAGDGPHLRVHRAYVVAPFHDKPLVYRLGDNEYTTDFYNEFLVSPSQMVTQLAEDWLRRSGDWPLVDSGQAGPATHLLDLNLLELYGDYRARKSQAAVVRLRVTLSEVDAEDGGSRVVFKKDYEARKDIPDRKAATLIPGMNQALSECLDAMGKDLRKVRG